MSTEYDAVLFDMDGVTVETAAAWHEIERTHVLPTATTGNPPSEAIRALSVEDAYEQLTGIEETSVVVDIEEFARLYDEQAEDVYREHATLLDGYHELIETIREAGFAVGLVSASRRSWVEMVIDRFDLHDAYDVVVTATDIDGPSKPDPTTYLEAADTLAVEPARCVVVEDSPHGIEAAVGAGMTCIGLRGDGNRAADLSEATVVVDGPAELRDEIATRLGL